MQISKLQTPSMVVFIVGVIVTVFISGCTNESGLQTHISGDAGVGVSSGDVSRISPSRSVPGRSY